jgi:hypothetical protein
MGYDIRCNHFILHNNILYITEYQNDKDTQITRLSTEVNDITYECTKLTPTIIETITRLNVYNHNKVYKSNI